MRVIGHGTGAMSLLRFPEHQIPENAHSPNCQAPTASLAKPGILPTD